MASRHPEVPDHQLVARMSPVLNPGHYIYLQWDRAAPPPDSAVLVFHENEGTTVILAMQDAEALISGADPERSWACEWITLQVFSGMDQVGLTGAVAQSLASEGLPCNMVAAMAHDHVFVPAGQGQRALKVLRELSESNGSSASAGEGPQGHSPATPAGATASPLLESQDGDAIRVHQGLAGDLPDSQDSGEAIAELARLRASIDNLDAAIVHLLAERFKCTQKVGVLKAEHGMPASDPSREARQIERLHRLAHDAELDPVFAERFLGFVIAEVIRHHRAEADRR